MVRSFQENHSLQIRVDVVVSEEVTVLSCISQGSLIDPKLIIVVVKDFPRDPSMRDRIGEVLAIQIR